MSRLEKAKEIIKANYKEAKHGIFNTRNLVGDHMETIYDWDGLMIDICREYGYFEVFGLTEDEFVKLSRYYIKLVKG